MLEEIFIPIVIGKSGINYKIHVLHTRYLLPCNILFSMVMYILKNIFQ